MNGGPWKRLSRFVACETLWSSIETLCGNTPGRIGCLASNHSSYRTYHADASEKASMMVVHPRSKCESSLTEALRLGKTYTGGECPHALIGSANRFAPNPSTFLGVGTIEALVNRCEVLNCQEVFVNSILSPIQHRNLERSLNIPVLDRVGLIIKIFAQRAQTREAKLQVQLAAMDYESSRLVRILDDQGRRLGFGEGGGIEVVSARERARGGYGGGGLGGGGAGEKELTLQKHKILARKKRIKMQIEQVRRTRALHRQGRIRGNVPVIAVIGYTNAGKSTLVSKLTKKELEQDDLLFKTLDPALRRLVLPSGKFAVLSDTVGFISKLPVSLVEAFQATLEEVLFADVLLHVIDASDENAKSQRATTLKVLQDLGLSRLDIEDRSIEVWNKVDRISLDAMGPAPAPLAHGLLSGMPWEQMLDPDIPQIQVSATTGSGISELKNVLEQKLVDVYGGKKWAPHWVPDVAHGPHV